MRKLSTWVDQLVDAVQKMLARHGKPPQATYRIQFQPQQMTFRDATAIVPYLSALGVSHLYASPCRRAVAGSANAYAIVDYNSLNPELGTVEDYEAMTAALDSHGMGQILDIVPNHMCVASDENLWWNDVLENGPSSPFAAHFDIEWKPVKEELENRILLPVLGDQYGAALEAGQLRLICGQGDFRVKVDGRSLPLDPKTYVVLLTHRLDELRQSEPKDSPDLRELESIVTALEHLPDRTPTAQPQVAERQREKEVVKDRLKKLAEGSAAVQAFIDRNIAEFNGMPGDARSFDRLDKLLDAQVYRLSHWKTAADEINYRRFFDINDLAAVCTENPDVFEQCHRFLFDLLVRGDVEGLRIDHVDGLFDPTEYLWRLQWGCLRCLGRAAFEQLRSIPQAGDAPSPAPVEADTPDRWEDIEVPLLQALWRRIGGVDPAQVFPILTPARAFAPETLRSAGEEPPAERTEGAPLGPRRPALYIVVEKILGPDEPLPAEWPVAGTTGYDFLNCVSGLFVDPAGLKELTSTYARFIGERVDFAEIAHDAKMLILHVAMSSELQMLAHRLNRISERHRRSRDFTLNAIRMALRETLACFPVYRTYVGRGAIADRDRRFIQRAVASAKRRNLAINAAVFDFVRDVLLLQQPPDLDEAGCRQRELFVGRFQQVTSPVMAKGVEDTAFYRYFPLASLNEVGGNPESPPIAVGRFHAENMARCTRHPHSLVATTTHDTKRSEDVRARINVLSEIPQLWRTAVNRWARLNRRHRQDLEGQPAPSRDDEYLFYQTLVGIWPLEPPGDDVRRQIVQRMQGYMEKATREAKLHTSWVNPDPAYDAAVRQFVAEVLEDRPKNRFLHDFLAFHQRVVDWGLYSALAQLVLKLTCPGVPDIYQGQELWDFSLVDPDNRRGVDFARRRELLAQLETAIAGGPAAKLALARQLGAGPRDPRLKLYVTWQLLRFRRDQATFFSDADYVPLEVEGSCAQHVCAFVRQRPATSAAASCVLVVVPRLVAQLTRAAGQEHSAVTPMDASVWKDTCVVCRDVGAKSLTSLFTGQTCELNDSRLPLAAALSDFPVAVFTK